MGKNQRLFLNSYSFFLKLIFMKQHEKVAWRENKKAGPGYRENGVLCCQVITSCDNLVASKWGEVFLWFDCLYSFREPGFTIESTWHMLFHCFDTEKGILHCLSQYLHSLPMAVAESWHFVGYDIPLNVLSFL